MMINKILQNKFLNRLKSVEFVVSEKCQNACEYCYRVGKHNKSPVTYIDPELTRTYLENLKDMFSIDNSFFENKLCELFGGDALLDYHKCNEIIDIVLLEYKFNSITIPTNARMLSEIDSYDIEKLLKPRDNRHIGVSLSIDGNFSDSQRPLSKFGRMLGYEEKLNYKKLFDIASKYSCGFHPMFSFEHPETWFDNFKFFVENGCTPYLLEVRHSLSDENIFKCIEQLSLIKTYVDTFIPGERRRYFNTIELSSTPRGLGCSAHTTLTIMPNGDIPFCHRVVDPPWVSANVLTKKMDVSKLITLVSGHHHSNHPECMTCPIKLYCSGNCAGACYEYWGDPWIPIKSICKYILFKNYVFSKLFASWAPLYTRVDETKLREKVYELFGEDTVEQFIISQRHKNDKI